MPALIAFDLDGVLYSSEPFLGDAYRDAIARVNDRRPGSFARVPATREILDHVGWPLSEIMTRLFPDCETAALGLLYVETQQAICSRVARGEGIIFARVPETLAALRSVGHRLAVASNGRRRYVETVLSANRLKEYFEPLATTDDVPTRDKAGILRAYVDRYRLTPAQLVLVGDRSSDVEAAAAIGCAFIGCDYGHGYRHEIEGHGPIVSSFADLRSLIAPQG